VRCINLSVGKGSINRVNKIKQSEKKLETSEKPNKHLEAQPSSQPKSDMKVETVEKLDKLHEEKFRVISRIKQDIPDYLL
jgi:hypothetical protein